jgi:hypothetical protein
MRRISASPRSSAFRLVWTECQIVRMHDRETERKPRIAVGNEVDRTFGFSEYPMLTTNE